MRSCKSFGGPLKLGFSMWLPVLRSGKGPKVFPMSEIPPWWIWCLLTSDVRNVFTVVFFYFPPEFCSPWPSGLATDADCNHHFPVTITTSDYVLDGPSVRDRRSRIVTLKVQTHAYFLWPHWCWVVQIVKMEILWPHVDGFISERRNSIANTLELRLSCTSPST